MQRRTLMLGACAAIAAPAIVRAQSQPKVTIAVGGKNLLYYLPLTIAESLGYFKDEGLDFTIVDFAGGSRALQARDAWVAALGAMKRVVLVDAQDTADVTLGACAKDAPAP